MIRVIYNKPEHYSLKNIAWTSLSFLSITYLVFIAFMNVCFENLGTKQPIPVLFICLSITAIDLGVKVFMTRRPFTAGNIIDVTVLFSLIISFSLYYSNAYKNLVFIQILTLLKMKDTIYFNIMLYELVKKNNFVFKCYVIIKIVYWIIVVGHLLGCTFYAVDNYLIKVQYFGPLALYPNSYYMGSEKVFTSIYSLSQQQKYLYGIYYSFSLISTCAFGDIIGHNYIEDIMVGGFLILSTIIISLIIEQMYIVFRRQKVMYYELTSRLKYVSEYIKTQPSITQQFRHDLINYMISSQWKEITSIPNLKQLTLKLEKSLFQESILMKTEDPLPLIIRTNFLPLLKSKYFPANYFLIDYNRLQNHLDGRIILNAKLNVGYTKQLIGKQYLQKQCISFGFDALIVSTNCLQKYFTVQLAEQSQVFVLNDDQFIKQMAQFKDYFNDYFPSPIEFFQISKDKIIFNRGSKKYCYQCKQKGHDLVDCPRFHYNIRSVSVSQIYFKHYKQDRQHFNRKTIKSRKNTSKKSFNQMKREKEGRIDLAVHFQIIKKIFDQNNLFQNLFEKAIVNFTQQRLVSVSDELDGYHVWKIYCPGGKL